MLKVGASLATLALLAAGSGAAAQSWDTRGTKMRASGDRTAAPAAKPGKGDGGMKPCPEYGAGFYRLGGSDTCALFGGGVASEIGTTLRR